jgi:hypothetical protein
MNNTKSITLIMGSALALFLSGQAWAATPTDINYCARGATALGAKYSTYTVRCSDGKKREITSWNQRKKWCVGTSRRCTNDQLSAAKKACGSKK